MDKIAELKQLVGEDVADEILSTSKNLTTRAKRLGLRYKEAHMPKFDEFLAAYKAYEAFNADGDGEAADFDDEVLFEDETVIEVETEKETTVKMETRMIEDAVMKAAKAAFAEMRTDSEEGEKVDDKKTKELAALKEANLSLIETVKELSDRVAALEQPIASGSGYRLTDTNPQATAKELQGAAANGTVGLIDSLGGIQ